MRCLIEWQKQPKPEARQGYLMLLLTIRWEYIGETGGWRGISSDRGG